MESVAVKRLSGWGRFPVEECRVFRPEKRREVLPYLLSRQNSPYIGRGLGRSYGDAAINGGAGVIDFSRQNRMIAFDPATGMLECEAGVSLAEIVEAFVPRGFFPSVMPGTKFVTVGGAIANDVHGKNHHKDGSFSQFVESFQLLTASGETMCCSRENNPDVFWATAGGIGLTGLILSARLELQRVETAYVKADYLRATCLDEVLSAISKSDDQYKYSVAWVDCLAKGAHLGRSVLMRGNFATAGDMRGRSNPLGPKRKREKTIPFDFPQVALNPLSIRAFNELYYFLHPSRTGKLVYYDDYFCPLDSILQWNRLYGKRGFAQYQVTYPPDDSGGLVELLEKLSRSSCASFLAVLKRLGPGNPGLLSYPREGYTLTLDIPMRPDLIGFLRELDRSVLDHGGRLYCAKDAAMLPETFAAMYPRLDEFRQIKARLDPDMVFSSSMARRLGIVERADA